MRFNLMGAATSANASIVALGGIPDNMVDGAVTLLGSIITGTLVPLLLQAISSLGDKLKKKKTRKKKGSAL